MPVTAIAVIGAVAALIVVVAVLAVVCRRKYVNLQKRYVNS